MSINSSQSRSKDSLLQFKDCCSVHTYTYGDSHNRVGHCRYRSQGRTNLLRQQRHKARITSSMFMAEDLALVHGNIYCFWMCWCVQILVNILSNELLILIICSASHAHLLSSRHGQSNHLIVYCYHRRKELRLLWARPTDKEDNYSLQI
jgi:hypothetical protein